METPFDSKELESSEITAVISSKEAACDSNFTDVSETNLLKLLIEDSNLSAAFAETLLRSFVWFRSTSASSALISAKELIYVKSWTNKLTMYPAIMMKIGFITSPANPT
ncbi:hypothetical protein LPTSP2_26090 [Leptospira ellinghausenii]|uniref:Uncharacterized protein n=1 Tax=Leptospira ellinghausenii TaxID=1917822 RepID=A0A2P2DFA9_9LEPT|nr:hypothetical protein LPTSP2_26090 [Leptospira ellinghausenii]